MPEPTIVRGKDHFFVTKWEGDGHGRRVGNFVPFTDNGTIAKSLIFADNTSDYLTQTQDSGTGDQKRKATMSWWFIRNKVAGAEQIHIGAAPSTRLLARFDTSDRLVFRLTNSTTEYQAVTDMKFEDVNKWYHVVWQIDASQATSSNRSRVWIDGNEVTSWASAAYPAQNTDIVGLADGTTRRLASGSHFEGQHFDGQLAEFNFIDGSIVDVSEFGITDTSTGRWIPKAIGSLTYGSNGFRLQFANSAGQTIGDDTSGNGNDFTTNGFTYTSVPIVDSPTQTYARLDGGSSVGGTIRYSRRSLITTNSGFNIHCTNFRPESGKWYAEFRYIASGSGTRPEVGIALSENFPYNGSTNRLLTSPVTDPIPGYGYYGYNGDLYKDSSNNTANTSLATFTDQGAIVGVALDLDNKVVRFFKNGASQGGYPLSHGRYCMYLGDGATGYDSTWIVNFGDNPTFCNGIIAGGTSAVAAANTDGFGSTFKYTPPDGFKALMQDNLPELSPKGATPKKPDLVWIKNREQTDAHVLFDSSRGPDKLQYPGATTIEYTYQNVLERFLVGGYEIGEDTTVNSTGEGYVGWNWIAAGGTESANSDGSGAAIASTIQANQTAGFSIVRFTGNSSYGKVAHGLSQEPDIVIQKRLNPAGNWQLNHKLYDGTIDYINFDTAGTNAGAGSNTIDAKTFSSANWAAHNILALCWHSVVGFSRFGTYVGNANVNGPFVYTGFKPRLVVVKNLDRGTNWYVYDTVRTPFNQMDGHMFWDVNTAETTGSEEIDFYANGFKCRGDNSGNNRDGEKFLFMAWAEHPFIGDGTNPATAR